MRAAPTIHDMARAMVGTAHATERVESSCIVRLRLRPPCGYCYISHI